MLTAISRVASNASRCLSRAKVAACPKTERMVSLSLVPTETTISRQVRDRLLTLVRGQARVVAHLGEVPPQPLERQVVEAFSERRIELGEPPLAVRAWARETALAFAGDLIVYQRALTVARRNRAAERVRLSPEDVAQRTCLAWLHWSGERPKTVRGVQAWAGAAALNYIIDFARHWIVDQDNRERFARDMAAAVHGESPHTPERLLADKHDAPKIIAALVAKLGKPGSIVVGLFRLQLEAAAQGLPMPSSAEAARALGTTPGFIDKARLIMRRRVRELRRAGRIDLDDPDDRV